MGTYIIRRILLMLPTLLGILFAVFSIMAMAPGDIASMLLSREGEMQAGDKRVRLAYLKRRYGLDQPFLVQFGRWLNRVSPLGFQTSSTVQFDQKEIDQVIVKLDSAPHITSNIKLQEAANMIVDIAAYLNEDLQKTADRVIQSTLDPAKVLNLLVEARAFEESDLKAEPRAPTKSTTASTREGPTNESFSEERLRFVGELRYLMKVDPKEASKRAIERLRDEADGLDRILFTHPTFKAPDFGESFIKKRPVLDLLSEALPVTLLLNLMSLPLVYSMAIGAGVYAAQFRGKAFDIVSGVTLLALWSIPTIWAGVMLRGLLANQDGWVRWFPTTGLHSLSADQMPFLPFYDAEGAWQAGWLLDMGWHLVLPVVCLSYGSFAFVSKLSRGALLENIMADYVRTARAKGLPGRQVLWRHAFRNSLLPLITIAAFLIPGLLSGSIIVEYIFSIEGMGKLAIESIKLKDQEVVMATTLISGVLTLLAFLIADLMYALADPRVAYE